MGEMYPKCDDCGRPPDGLTPLAEWELDNEPYSFNEVRIYRDAAGSLWWGADSGCSCPCPFENQTLDPLRTEADWRDVEGHVSKASSRLTEIMDEFHALRMQHLKG